MLSIKRRDNICGHVAKLFFIQNWLPRYIDKCLGKSTTEVRHLMLVFF